MLQYALLHLFGYKVSMDDLKAFRVSASNDERCEMLMHVLDSRQHLPRSPRGP